MIKESAELVSVVTRWVEAMNRRDFATVSNLFLRSTRGRYVGTDSHEWWQGTDYIDAYAPHQDEMPEFFMDVQELEAFESGEFGWAAVRTVTTFKGLEPRPFRLTFVFVLDSGFWRIVQTHGSFAVPNPEVMGVEMTRSLEDLLASIGSSVAADIRSTVRQGTVTLVFTDIEGSTELAADVGDEEWAKVIDWHDNTMRRIIEVHDGTLVKTLGDGAMAAFESVRQAARSAFEIQRAFDERSEPPVMKVRIGLHVGDVVLTEDDYLGNTVNKAARIAAAARGGEVVTSSSVRALLGDDPEFSFGEVRTVELKGIEGLHEIARIMSGTLH
jgi:class 3 adenylate cyclase